VGASIAELAIPDYFSYQPHGDASIKPSIAIAVDVVASLQRQLG
jgi:hypothetical protein